MEIGNRGEHSQPNRGTSRRRYRAENRDQDTGHGGRIGRGRGERISHGSAGPSAGRQVIAYQPGDLGIFRAATSRRRTKASGFMLRTRLIERLNTLPKPPAPASTSARRILESILERWVRKNQRMRTQRSGRRK